MSKITREELETQLQTAINQRARQYDRVVGFAFHFTSDDTGSKQDVDHFRHILKMLGGGVLNLMSTSSKVSRDPNGSWRTVSAKR